METSATIKINANKIIGEIDRKIYGHFIENLGRVIYGGLFQDNKVRKDVVEAIEKIKPPIIRWPGGLYADQYNWRKGVGEQRKLAINKYWGMYLGLLGFFDPNTFGTDEFIEFCREVGAEPYINVNYGRGEVADAVDWLKYTNKAHDYQVKYWGIGNEIFGFWAFGHTKAPKYAQRYLEFCQEMRKIDESIKFIAVGADENFPNWNREVLRVAGEYIDYLSIHIYLPIISPVYFFTARLDNNEKNYYSIVAAPKVFEKKLNWVADRIKEAGLEDKVYIALDEWNIWWHPFQLMRVKYTLRDALFVAGVLNVLQKLSNVVKIANLAQLINAVGLIQTKKDDVFLSPSALVFSLYSNFAQEEILETDIETSTYSSTKFRNIPSMDNIPYLDCSATINDKKGKLSLFIINRHFKEKITAKITIENFKLPEEVKVYELTGKESNAKNDFKNKEKVKINERTVNITSNQFEYTLSSHSLITIVI